MTTRAQVAGALRATGVAPTQRLTFACPCGSADVLPDAACCAACFDTHNDHDCAFALMGKCDERAPDSDPLDSVRLFVIGARIA